MTAIPPKRRAASWSVYIVRCADGTLYTGVARDAVLRVREHNEGCRGAKYTRARRPVSLVHVEGAADRSAAQKREAAIKRLERGKKEDMIRRATKKRKPRSTPRGVVKRGSGRKRKGRSGVYQ